MLNIFIPEKHNEKHKCDMSFTLQKVKKLEPQKDIWLNSFLYIFFCHMKMSGFEGFRELTHLTGRQRAWRRASKSGIKQGAASKSPINPRPPQKLDCVPPRQATTKQEKLLFLLERNWRMNREWQNHFFHYDSLSVDIFTGQSHTIEVCICLLIDRVTSLQVTFTFIDFKNTFGA